MGVADSRRVPSAARGRRARKTLQITSLASGGLAKRSGVTTAGCRMVNAGCSVSEDQHLREREVFGVSDGQQGRSAADRGKSPRRSAMKLKLRRPASPYDLDVAPEDLLRVARSERLHGRFLGCEAAGEMYRGGAPPLAVGHLTVGEDTTEEALTVALDGRLDAVNVRGVEAEP
jgi:hypothetical protein